MIEAIIRLVIKIFQEAYEKDRKHRQTQQKSLHTKSGATHQKSVSKKKKKKKRKVAAELRRQIQEHFQFENLQQVPQLEHVDETYGEFLERNQTSQKIVKEDHRRIESRENSKAYAVNHDVHRGIKRREEFKLPGNTPLEQMIWAQTIMGPCKAHSR